MREIGVDALSSPELTGQWEYKLKQMEHGSLSREEFMREIIKNGGIKLPELPRGQRYVYDPKRGELMVEKPVR